MAGKKNAIRLTPQDRGVIFNSKLSVKKLAEQYGVSQSTIYKNSGKLKKLSPNER